MKRRSLVRGGANAIRKEQSERRELSQSQEQVGGGRGRVNRVK